MTYDFKYLLSALCHWLSVISQFAYYQRGVPLTRGAILTYINPDSTNFKFPQHTFMRKELIIAIIVGIGVGVALAFGFYRANSALKSSPANPTSPQEVQNESQTQSSRETKTVLARPKQNEVVTENPTKVSGITNPNAWITISGEDEDYVLQADAATGAFEQEVDLTSGVNQVILTSFDEKGDKNVQNLTLVYSAEFAK